MLGESAMIKASFAALLYLLYRCWLDRKRAARLAAARRSATKRLDTTLPVMDTRRQAALARGQAIDHSGCCVEQEDPNFSLEGTIFASVEGAVPRMILRKQLARVPFWCDESVQAIHAAYAALPPPPPVDRALTDFMMTQCDFKVEHADGSFMDHVTFCHDYCAAYYKAVSPRVLLLHSILGVGTNVFPMKLEKLPELSKLVSAEELRHIEVFPSVLRLLVATDFLAQLFAQRSQLDRVDKVSLRRVIDNTELEMDAETFWVQLNYQVVHFLDFLPVTDWSSRFNEPLMGVFLELRSLLEGAGQLRAKVELGSACGDAPSQEELLRAAAASPFCRLKRRLSANAVRKYSEKIGHSLEFSLHFR